MEFIQSNILVLTQKDLQEFMKQSCQQFGINDDASIILNLENKEVQVSYKKDSELSSIEQAIVSPIIEVKGL